MPTLPDKSIDMILCDLPYGTTSCKWDVVLPFDRLWGEYSRLLKTNGVAVFTAAQPFTTLLIHSNMKWFKYCWIWQKPRGVDPFLAKIRPLNNYEEIVVFSRGKAKYYPQMEVGKPYSFTRDKKARTYEVTATNMKPMEVINNGERYPTRILKFNQEKGYHPTQKPVALFEYLIKTYSAVGDVVLDNCMGSGTTGVACGNTARNFIGIEKEEKYFCIAKERVGNSFKENVV